MVGFDLIHVSKRVADGGLYEEKYSFVHTVQSIFCEMLTIDTP